MAVVQDPAAVRLPQLNCIKSVACGRAHTLLLSGSSQVFAMGDNSLGQLGVDSAMGAS